MNGEFYIHCRKESVMGCQVFGIRTDLRQEVDGEEQQQQVQGNQFRRGRRIERKERGSNIM